MSTLPTPTTILFDFGGVLAEEGYAQGLEAISIKFGHEPSSFFETVTEIIYGCGFVTGKTDEHAFWHLVREATGITGEDNELTEEILSRFILRPKMLSFVASLKRQNISPVILSDQTNWLDRLEKRNPFFSYFDQIFNSYYLGKTKREESIFPETLAALDVPAEAALFVDDNRGHIERAQAHGLQTHFFCDQETFLSEMSERGLM